MTDITDSNIVSIEEANPYAYLDRDFTSEKYKIKLSQLPKFYGISELKKLINDTLKLSLNKIKTPRKCSPLVYICFRDDESRKKAIEALNGYKWKGKQLMAEESIPTPDPLIKKRKELENNDSSSKKLKFNFTQEEQLKMSTIPYHDTPYNEQLRLKQDEVHKILMKIGNEIWKSDPRIQSWVENQRKIYNGLPCELLNVKFAEKCDGYRTKCEFTVGIDQESKLPTVGFRLGRYVSGFTGVGPVENLLHIPQRMKIAVKYFEKFVRSYDLKVYNPENQEGHFHQLTARLATIPNQLMLVVGIQTRNLNEDKIIKLKDDLKDFFENQEGKEVSCDSLYFQRIQKKKPGDKVPKLEHISGLTHIQETLLDLKFDISPEAFFQINTPVAELMYSSAIELVQPTKNTTLVDICCGTGTIGLCFAKHCGQVLGLECVPQAIMDAKRNAEINNIENVEFFEGRVEDILNLVLSKATQDEVIAIVDPPRAGIHNRSIVQLRGTKKINKLLYISCDPTAALKNFIDLSRPPSKTMHREPFLPVKAVAVDMFPYTKHFELLIYFERFKDDTVISENPKEKSIEDALIVKDLKENTVEAIIDVAAGKLENN